MNNNFSKLSSLALLATVLFTACEKDAAYDALTEKNGIDMTVSVANGGLTIPLGSTGRIPLKELIDPDESDIVDTDEQGNYFIAKEGSFDPSTFNVESPTINVAPTIDPEVFTFEVDPEKNGLRDSIIVDEINLFAEIGTTLDVIIESAIDRAIYNEVETQIVIWENKAIDEYKQRIFNETKTNFPMLTDDQIWAIVNPLVDTYVTSLKQDGLYDHAKDSIHTAALDSIKPGIMNNVPKSFTATCPDLTFNTLTEIPLKAENVDEGLLDIQTVIFDPETNTAALHLDLSGLPPTINGYDIEIEDFKLIMPYYVHMSDQKGYVSKSQQNIVSIREIIPVAANNDKANLDIIMSMDSILFNEGDLLVNQDKTLSRSGDQISVSGTASTTNMQIETKEIVLIRRAVVENGKIKENGMLGLKNSINIDPSIDPINTKITEVRGHFDPSIDQITTDVNIELNDDLDFLKDENIKLDFTNPEVTIDIKNTCPIDIFADITLIPDNGCEPLVFKNVSLSPLAGDSAHVVLNAQNEGVDLEGNRTYYKNAALSTFLQPMPEHIDVKIDVAADAANYYTLTLGEEFSVSGDYHVSVPLLFNNVHILYDEVIEDIWGDDSDITDMLTSIDKATLTFDTESDIPLNLNLTLTANDKNGVKNDNLIHSEISEIRTGKSQISAKFSIPDVAAVKDLVIHLTGDGTTDGQGNPVQLRSNQYLKLSNIKFSVKDLELDLNEK